MTLLFACKLEESNLGYLGSILLLFGAISDLKVNWPKSVLIPIKEVPDLHHLVQFFGCGFAYLGVLIGASHKCKNNVGASC